VALTVATHTDATDELGAQCRGWGLLGCTIYIDIGIGRLIRGWAAPWGLLGGPSHPDRHPPAYNPHRKTSLPQLD